MGELQDSLANGADADPAYAAGWYGRTLAAPRRWPALAVDLDVDACVVGGGFAGLAAALEIARRGWSVALIEAQRIAWQASGRNLGFVLPGFQQDVERIVARCGLDHARRLWGLSEDGVDYIRDLIHDTGMPGVNPVGGWLEVSKTDNADGMMRTLTLLGQEFGAAVEGWPVEQVREVLKTDRYFHGLHYRNAFHIHPLNYAFGLAAAAEAAGVRIFEDTPALTLDPAGVRKRIVTPNGRLRAGTVVLAANTGLGALAPELAQTVLPVSTYVAVTEPLGDRLADAVAYPGAVSDGRSANHHYRIVDGDRLMWSGYGTTWVGNPRRYIGPLVRAIERTYPQLGKVAIADVWGGVMGFTVHRMPQIGEVSPGLWIASGFGGHGLNTSAMAGVIVARAVVEHDDTWRAFLPYDLVWAGGALGRAVQQGLSWWRRRWQAFEAERARRRQAARAA